MVWRPLDEFDTIPTLGYLAADWMSEFLLRPDSQVAEPFTPTQEQIDFLVRLYEVDRVTGKRVKQRAVLSRPRGSGKSPFAAAIAAFEAMGPAVGDGFDAAGQPVGVPWEEYRTPLVQITATTEDQAANTWLPLLEMLRGAPAEVEYDLDVMETFVALRRGRIETRTASSSSVKGARAVCAILDQTETWLPGNGGVKLAQTLRSNAYKVKGVTIETPNAFTVGENSVAEESAKTWELHKAGKVRKEARRLFLYDHRAAPVETKLEDWDSLVYGLRVAYGDASAHPGGCVIHEPACPPGWVDLDTIAAAFYDPINDPLVMSADFLNQITHASNAWVTQTDLRAIEDTTKKITPSEPITLGFDGSEGRKIGIADCTVLIGYSVRQQHLFKIGIWSQPHGAAGEGWTPPRLEIEQTIRDTFERYNVVGFYADPSAGWAGDVKQWEADYGRRLSAVISPNEPIKYPKQQVSRTCEAFSELESAIRRKAVTYDGAPDMTAHFLNARRSPRRAGYVLEKPIDDQDRAKIDAAWGAMFAYRAGLDAIGKGAATKTEQRRRVRRIR